LNAISQGNTLWNVKRCLTLPWYRFRLNAGTALANTIASQAEDGIVSGTSRFRLLLIKDIFK
jgi:hypothetical protein